MMMPSSSDPDDFVDIENALPFRQHSTRARIKDDNSRSFHDSGSHENNQSTSPAYYYQETPRREIFRESPTFDNRARTPLYPIPKSYLQQQEPRSAPPKSSTVHRYATNNLHDNELPIDSDTLLPLSSADYPKLHTSVPSSTGQGHIHQGMAHHPHDTTSAITMSPAIHSNVTEEESPLAMFSEPKVTAPFPEGQLLPDTFTVKDDWP